jgi:hypothetical protein
MAHGMAIRSAFNYAQYVPVPPVSLDVSSNVLYVDVQHYDATRQVHLVLFV